jgi:hypothetical protein
MLSSGELIGGTLMLALVAGCAGGAGWLVVRRHAPDLSGLPRLLAWSLCATAALIVIHLAPLALGILTRGTVLVAALIVAGAALALRGPAAAAQAPRVPAGPDGGFLPRACALVAAALAAGAGLSLLVKVAGVPTLSVDALNFQIPVVAHWIQTGSAWGVKQFGPDYSTATYPQNGNVLILAATLPFHSAFLARLVAVPYGILACAAVYACAREIGAARAWALLCAAAIGAMPVIEKVSLDGAQTDAPMFACMAAGALFLLRHRRTGARSDLVLAGLGLGLAFGCKWYALPTVAVVLVIWAAARVLAGARVAAVAREGAALVVLVLAGGGFWLLRNWVGTGNPLFPQPVHVLGVTVFGAPRDTVRELGGFTLAHYWHDTDVWRTYLRPAFSLWYSAAGLAAAVAGAAGGVLAWRRREPALTLAITAVALAIVYTLTPYSAFGPDGAPVLAGVSTRYGVPALLAAAVAAAWAGTRLPRIPAAVLAGLLLLGVLDGLHKAYGPALATGDVVAGALIVALGAWAARRASRHIAPAAVGAVAASALLLAGPAIVRHRTGTRSYATADPTLGWIVTHAPQGAHVALAGGWTNDAVSPVLPAFGPRLRNRVTYVGRDDDHILRQEQQAGFRADLRRGRYDLLIVGRGSPPDGPVPEEGWARDEGYMDVVASNRLALLRRAQTPSSAR